ncbi:MAG: 3'-5' exonuclease [Limosilactobacillus pontis]
MDRKWPGEKISYYRAQSEHDEAQFIVSKIMEEREKHGYHYNDFAILYRTNAQSRVIEETFLKSSVPYTMVGGHSSMTVRKSATSWPI